MILTHGYWQRRFGGDKAAVGRTITIDLRPREIIGVMPQGFKFLNADPDVILPRRFEGNQLHPNDVHAYAGIARLKPGVSLLQANADVRRMLPIWITQYGTNGPVLRAARYSVRSALIGEIAAARPAGMMAAKNAQTERVELCEIPRIWLPKKIEELGRGRRLGRDRARAAIKCVPLKRLPSGAVFPAATA